MRCTDKSHCHKATTQQQTVNEIFPKRRIIDFGKMCAMFDNLILNVANTCTQKLITAKEFSISFYTHTHTHSIVCEIRGEQNVQRSPVRAFMYRCNCRYFAEFYFMFFFFFSFLLPLMMMLLLFFVLLACVLFSILICVLQH